MICKKCGYDFSGNFCPKCGTGAHSDGEAEFREENPYSPVYDREYACANDNVGREGAGAEPEQYIPQPQQAPLYDYEPGEYKYKKQKAPLVLSIIAICLSALTLIISCSDLNTSDIPSFEETEEYTDTTNSLGDTVRSGDFVISSGKAKTADSYEGKTAREGHEFLSASFIAKNSSDSEQYWECEISCYADDMYCTQASSVDEDGYTYCNLPAGKSVRFEVVFEVPENAEEITINLTHYAYGFFDDETVTHSFILNTDKK